MVTNTTSIYTFLHGQVLGKIQSQRDINPDEDRDMLTFEVGPEDYRAYVFPRTFPNAKLVLFDGEYVPHGMPAGATCLDYEYGRRSDEYRVLGQKKGTQIESLATVYQPEIPLPERVVVLERSRVEVTYHRYLMAIMHGRSCLFMRFRPRSLKRQYFLVTATQTEVKIQSLVG
jgi:hypothetical protein